MSSLVSVVVPTFNRAHVLQRAIDSVLAQGHREIEVIVVDDGSTDDTSDLVQRVYVEDKRVHYVGLPHGGVSVARNAGIGLATGGFIAFLDSDDAWQPWHLSLQLAALDKHPEVGLVWTDMEAVDASGAVVATSYRTEHMSAWRNFTLDDLFASSFPLTSLGVDLPTGADGGRLYVGDIFSKLILGALIHTSSVVLRRERLDDVGRFDELMPTGEDYEFYLRVCRAGPVAFADVADTRYQIGTRDRLSGPAMSLAIAKAYLQVLDATLARDGDRITLPPSTIAAARAYAHRWVGEVHLQEGSAGMARRHLAESLRLRPAQPRAFVLLGLALLPRGLFQLIVRWRRRVKNRLPVLA
jgi:GT2 family glycosyltransferase